MGHMKLTFRIVQGVLLCTICYVSATLATSWAGILMKASQPSMAPLQAVSTGHDGPDLMQRALGRQALSRVNLFTPIGHRRAASLAKADKAHTQADQRARHTQPTKRYPPCHPKAPVSLSRRLLSLKGTSVASDAAYSVAMVYNRKRRKMLALRVGDSVQGALVCSISHRTLKLAHTDGTTEVLLLGFFPLTRKRQRRRWRRRRRANYWRRRWRRKQMRRRGGRLLSRVKTPTPGHFVIPREMIRPMLHHSRLLVLRQGVKVLPYFRQGRLMGLRVSKIRRGSFFERLGLRDGDVIHSVNHTPVKHIRQAVRMYYDLRHKRQVSIQTIRAGQIKELTYTLQG